MVPPSGNACRRNAPRSSTMLKPAGPPADTQLQSWFSCTDCSDGCQEDGAHAADRPIDRDAMIDFTMT